MSSQIVLLVADTFMENDNDKNQTLMFNWLPFASMPVYVRASWLIARHLVVLSSIAIC